MRNFYREAGGDYRNPHESRIALCLRTIVRECRPDLSHVLDLAAGSGEATLVLRELGAGRIDGIDPFTHEAYRARTGVECGRESFEEIAAGALRDRHWSLIVCSFAMHLLEPSRLPDLAWQLSRIGDSLLIVTPNKRPILHPGWGWHLRHETLVQRVRARLYEAVRMTDDSPAIR